MSHGLTLHELRQDSGVPRGGAGAQGTPVSPIMQQEQADGVQAQGTFSGETWCLSRPQLSNIGHMPGSDSFCPCLVPVRCWAYQAVCDCTPVPAACLCCQAPCSQGVHTRVSECVRISMHMCSLHSIWPWHL